MSETKRKKHKRRGRSDLPKYCYLRGDKIWVGLKDECGKWQYKPTPYTVDQVELARRFVQAAMRKIKVRVEQSLFKPLSGPLTVRLYGDHWLKNREARAIASAPDERARLEKYAYPYLGDVLLEELRPHHVRDMVRALRALPADKAIAPRTILHVFRALHNLYQGAVVDELVQVNPCVLNRGELPKKVDADPEWRSRATFTVREVERLISDPLIPVERRVQYALKAIAGMRHGEVAGLLWRHVDRTMEPLGRINVVQAYCSRTRQLKSTKTEQTRAVPIHPTLAKILAAWRLTHWARIYGRQPADDDFVVPTRAFTGVNVADAVIYMADDLTALGMRTEAGKKRKRGGHDLRSWFMTRCIEDGADSLLVERTTHSAPKTVVGGYDRFSWSAICREVAKLKVDILDGEVLAFTTASLQREKSAGRRWTSPVTPLGLETKFESGSGAPLTSNSDDSRRGIENGGAHLDYERALRVVAVVGRDRDIAGALASIAEALAAGDASRVSEIVRELESGVPDQAVQSK